MSKEMNKDQYMAFITNHFLSTKEAEEMLPDMFGEDMVEARQALLDKHITPHRNIMGNKFKEWQQALDSLDAPIATPLLQKPGKNNLLT